MFDIGGFELLLIAALALIVVGPKELPGLIRNVGRWVQRARSLARDFQSGMEDAAREADLHDLKKLGDVGQDLKRDVASLGDQTKSMIENPMATPTRDAAPTPGAPEAGGRIEPSFDAPAPKPAPSPSVQVREAPVDADAAARGNGAAREDDDAFLDRFQRGVRGDASGS